VVLVALIALYVGLGLSLWFVLGRMSARWRAGEEVTTPYGPPGAEAEPVVDLDGHDATAAR
jgi:hypothetical protein